MGWQSERGWLDREAAAMSSERKATGRHPSCASQLCIPAVHPSCASQLCIPAVHPSHVSVDPGLRLFRSP